MAGRGAPKKMNTKVYFNKNDPRRGKYYDLKEEIRSKEGGSFEIEEWINHGGNASVFRGYNRSTDMKCAIKFLMKSNNTTANNRFTREIDLLKQINEGHTIGYLGSGKVSACHNITKENTHIRFIVMELAERNLQEMMWAKSKLFDYEFYAGQFRGLAGALAALHDIAAVHRDIKPENILILGERWLLSDYGLCSFVNPDEDEPIRDGPKIGPKYWLSPEAHNRRLNSTEEICPASDVFQLASIFWYVVTGRYPCGVVTKTDWPGPNNLFDVLYMSLHHDAKKRPQDGKAFLTDLQAALSP